MMMSSPEKVDHLWFQHATRGNMLDWCGGGEVVIFKSRCYTNTVSAGSSFLMGFLDLDQCIMAAGSQIRSVIPQYPLL